MTDRRYQLDHGAQRYGRVLVGGSPLKLFRLTDAGARLLDRVEAGEAVTESKLVTSLVDAGAVHPVPTDVPRRFRPDDVTIVTPTFGHTPDTTDDTTVVVDDGSDPPIAGATVRLEHNRGPGAARNVGFRHVTTPLVAFVDADVHLPVGWLDPLLPHFDDERVGMVAPRVRSTPGASALDRYERDHSPLDSRVGCTPGAG